MIKTPFSPEGDRKNDKSQKNQSRLLLVPSRQDLLIGGHKNQVLKQDRKTQITCTIGKKTLNTQILRNMILTGCDNFLINPSFLNLEQSKELIRLRNQFENELNRIIPIIMMLKGTIVRTGEMQLIETFIKKGQEYRLTSRKKIIGTHDICSVDHEEFIDSVQIGDTILIDHGQIIMKVVQKETLEQTKQFLDKKQNTPNSSPTKQKIQIIQKIPSQSIFSIDESLENNELSKEKEESKLENIEPLPNETVLVCEVKTDSLLKSHKPIYINRDINQEHLLTENLYQLETFQYQDSLDSPHKEISEYQILNDSNLQTIKQDHPEDFLSNPDQELIEFSIENGVDAILAVNIKEEGEVTQVKNYVQDRIKVLVRIQNLDSVVNYDKILQISDGIMIARGYMMIHIPLQLIYKVLQSLIQQCHKNFKPVIVSCNVLESMISSVLPTSNEASDICNLVSRQVDSITLIGETAYGKYPERSIETLSQFAVETEQDEIQSLSGDPLKRTQDSFIEGNQIVGNTLISSCLESAYRLKASLAIVFTQTGYTAIKLSKMKMPCPILAVVDDLQTARYLQIFSNISCLQQSIDEFITDQTLVKTLQAAKQNSMIKSGDYAIVLYGEIQNISGMTNSLKIVVCP